MNYTTATVDNYFLIRSLTINTLITVMIGALIN